MPIAALALWTHARCQIPEKKPNRSVENGTAPINTRFSQKIQNLSCYNSE